MSKEYYVIGLRLDHGGVSPLAWAKDDLSNAEIKKATKKFKRDADVVSGVCLPHWRLYDTVREMKAELPEYA